MKMMDKSHILHLMIQLYQLPCYLTICIYYCMRDLIKINHSNCHGCTTILKVEYYRMAGFLLYSRVRIPIGTAWSLFITVSLCNSLISLFFYFFIFMWKWSDDDANASETTIFPKRINILFLLARVIVFVRISPVLLLGTF